MQWPSPSPSQKGDDEVDLAGVKRILCRFVPEIQFELQPLAVFERSIIIFRH